MNVSITILLVSLLIIGGCTSKTEPINHDSLFDTWVLKFESFTNAKNPSGTPLEPVDSLQAHEWTFTEDSIYITDYPINLIGSLYYEYIDGGVHFPKYNLPPPLFPAPYNVEMNEDTLILTKYGIDKVSSQSLYFFKSTYPQNEIDYLISEKVDWYRYFGDTLHIRFNPRIPDTTLKYPTLLNLRESNNNNFHTSKDTLFYSNKDGLHVFKFLYITNSLDLFYLNDTTGIATLCYGNAVDFNSKK